MMQQVISSKEDVARRALSREICERLDWRSVDGRVKEMSCRVALSKLERGGKIRLRPARLFRGQRKYRPMKAPVEAMPIRCGLQKLQPIELVPIRGGDREQSK